MEEWKELRNRIKESARQNVQIEYADPDEDDAFDECIVRACW